MAPSEMDGRRRVVIGQVSPEIDCGRFAVKRVVGETVVVEANVFADGHDQVACQILFWRDREKNRESSPMQPIGNDRWRGRFPVQQLGRYCYTVEGWVDLFQTWRSGLLKRIAAGQNVEVELLVGAKLIEDAAARASGQDGGILEAWGQRLRQQKDPNLAAAIALEERALPIIEAYPDRRLATQYEKTLRVTVDRERARFSTWYEVFPRSTSPGGNGHGTFADWEAWLPYIAEMGFDIVYLPPLHPIGRSFRKGKNNALSALPDDVGSPWAIGSEEGGHKSIHPQLGTLADFRRFVLKAEEHKLEVALDIAFQCTPDHPYVREHREWFRSRPDGSIQYAENPPKKYQDIYPLDFESPGWRDLWQELKSVFEFWIAQGVRIFRVDNPHTKPFRFWEWVIGEINKKHNDIIFLSEAFTRPRVMASLAKGGFT